MFSTALPRALRTASRRPPIYQCQNPSQFPKNFQSTRRQWPGPRHISNRALAQRAFKEHPFSFAFACSTILVGLGAAVYVAYNHESYVVAAFHKFPEPVANKLRRALYYSIIDLNPQKAIDYYRQALALGEEIGMDQFSDEILGVKLKLASFLEEINQHQLAIDVLEIVRADCKKWIETIGGREGREIDRSRVLAKTVGISVKLGELYANQYIMEPEEAEKNLIEGVETVFRELQRREKEGVKEDNVPWMTNEEMGGAMEALATSYEQKNLHYLAAPLYLRCLSLLPQTSCHAVVLMNNLSISLAQQSSPPTSSTPPASRSALVSSARTWAQKSLAIAALIKPPERNEECDVGCAVATHNLGEFAEMDGDLAEARKKYEEAKALSRAVGFSEGVDHAEEGLKRIGGV